MDYSEQEKSSLDEKYAFILAWTAVIWKRIWRCAYLYSEHQNIPLNTDVILKCLKYNLLSPTGIVKEILPSLEKALTQGFLMPNEYEKNKYVKNAVKLFGESYKISKNQKGEKEFIKNYSSKIDEKEDKDILNVKTDKKDSHCEFCHLISVWDIELGLYEFDNTYQVILLYTLLKILDD